ncbi:hypothetical protein O1L60_25580 [Streptomyces diastatochromogenes]|nr:hypothetical protein [Streptomyces diastatochromogenes]
MASHRKLRAAAVVCAAVVTGPCRSRPERRPSHPARRPRPAPTPPGSLRGPHPRRDRRAGRDRHPVRDLLRMTGKLVSEGQPLGIDFAVNDKDECTGLIKIEDGAAELRRLDHITYLKGDEAFWRASMTSQGMSEPQISATIELIKGRWLKIAPGQAGSQDLGGVCDLKSLLSDLDKDKAQRRGLTRGPDAKVDGTPVATLVKKKPNGETTTVSVSERGRTYILKMVKAGGDEPGALVLSDYDKPVDVKVPPADETVDLSKLDSGQPA